MGYKVSSTSDLVNIINSENAKMKNFYLIMGIALGGIILDGYIFATLGIGVDGIAKTFGLKAISTATISAIMGVGALIGAIIGGYFADKIGRNKMFLINMILFIVGSFGAAFSINVYMFYLFRAMMGAGVGLDFPVALSFIVEHSKLSSKGKNVSIWQSVNGIGFIIAYFLMILVITYLSPGNNLWRYAAGIGGVIAIAVLILRYIFMRESPIWLATQGYLKDAVRILKENYGIDAELDESAVEKTSKIKPFSAIKLLFSKKYRTRTILLTIISPVQAIEYYAVVIFLPIITASLFVTGEIMSFEYSAIFQFFGVLGPLFAMAIVQRLGMKKLGIVSAILIIIVLLILGGTANLPVSLSFTLIALFIFVHTLGIGPLPMSESSISYPARIRGTGSGWSQMMVRVGTILGLFLFPYAHVFFGLKNTFLFLLFVPIVVLISFLIFSWEPIGKDIDNEWTNEDEKAITS